MALLGEAAIAMWWDMAGEMRAEFEHWHSHEHFPERMGVPGFQRGSRWASAEGGEGFFVLYELQDYDTLSSPGYLARLNAPTPWSTRLMPHHRQMVRSQCRVLASHGGALAGHVLTVRLTPAEGAEDRLRQKLSALAQDIALRPGSTAGHLLQTRTPAMAATTEQQIRGGADQAADWIFLACGYELAALQALAADELGDEALQAAGSAAGSRAIRGLYRLAHSNTAQDAG
ncbi:hypothetical protein GT347_23210 [Xylophilus rhododendri]|uniref:Uncharacterized protein n=1 Tax=Xylophilus rhododendri TaxID=2697032 RepID=A0A857JD87_9BURK|nr:hypothetical protein [Xylophilus rhododendri]QHJ00636.1 hypothetical protein GT347_23210 [Xylophilus rhododendri]